jgi:hypothetical protein
MTQNSEWNELASVGDVDLAKIVIVCAGCRRVKDELGNWKSLNMTETKHTAVSVSHGLCLDCVVKLYPAFAADFEGHDREATK